MLSAFGHPVETCWVLKTDRTSAHALVQHCCTYLAKRLQHHGTSKNVKPWPNDNNISTQIIATLLGATRCVRLAMLLRCVALKCCDRLASD